MNWTALFLPFTFAFSFSMAQAHARIGIDSSGGGDSCEDRVQIIRADLHSWIGAGGPQGLALPQNLSVADYSKGMTAAFKSTKIRCVGAGDAGFPVKIGKAPKVCIFETIGDESQITCDFAKFQSLSESEQYVLIHHEYSGIAKFEVPDAETSTYFISNQISSFLENVLVKKLAVKPVVNPGAKSVITLGPGEILPAASLTSTSNPIFSNDPSDHVKTSEWRKSKNGHTCVWVAPSNTWGDGTCDYRFDFLFTVQIGGYSFDYVMHGAGSCDIYRRENGSHLSCSVSDQELTSQIDQDRINSQDQVETQALLPLLDANDGKIFSKAGACYINKVRIQVDPSSRKIKKYWFEPSLVACP